MCQSRAFYSGFDKFFYVRRHKVQAPEIPIKGLLKATSRKVVSDAEAIEIKFKNTLLVGVVWISHADVSIEAPGPLCQRFVDGLGMICGGDRDDIGVGGPPSRTKS